MNKFVVTQDGNCAINANNTCLFYKKAEVDSKFSINALLRVLAPLCISL